MKRSRWRGLGAVALLSAASPGAAQNGLTIYGRLDLSLDHLDVKPTAGASRSINALSNDASRLGLRGSEDLGGGWRAGFNLESGIAPDTGTITQGGVFWGRTAWVGLSGPAGEARFGRNYVPMDDMAVPLDPFYFTGVGAMLTLLPYAARVNNSVKYISPSAGGLQAEGLVSASEGTAGGTQLAIAAAYKDDVVEARVAGTLARSAVAAGDRRELLIGGAARFGASRVTALFFQRADDGAASKSTTAMIGANLAVGSGEVRASHARVRQGAEGTRRFAVGYLYPLSRRTFLYAGAAHQHNTAQMHNTVNPALLTLADGDDITAWQLGLRHLF